MANNIDLQAVADNLRVGEILLPPSISVGVVSFGYTVFARIADIILVYLCFLLLAHRISSNVTTRANLFQRIALNDFGVKLQVNPTLPWWKAWYPYSFQKGVVYRKTGFLILVILGFSKLAMSWSELLTEAKVETILKVEQGTVPNQSFLFGEELESKDGYRLSWSNLELATGDYSVRNFARYYRSLAKGSTAPEQPYNDYPNAICFQPRVENGTTGSATCEGIHAACQPLTNDNYDLWQMRSDDFSNEGNFSTENNVLSISLPSVFRLMPDKAYNQTHSVGLDKWRQYPIGFGLPIETENICKDIPQKNWLNRISANYPGLIQLDSQTGWYPACNSMQQSMMVYMGVCYISWWRGTRQVNVKTREFLDTDPLSEDLYVKFEVQENNTEAILGSYIPRRTGDLLQSLSALNMTTLKPSEFTNAHGEKLYAQLLISLALGSAQGTVWTMPGAGPTYEIEVETSIIQQAIYLYPLAIIIAIAVAILGYLLTGTTFKRIIRAMSSNASYGPIEPIELQMQPQKPQSRAASPSPQTNILDRSTFLKLRRNAIPRQHLTPTRISKEAETLFVDDQLTSLGVVRYILRHFTAQALMEASQFQPGGAEQGQSTSLEGRGKGGNAEYLRLRAVENKYEWLAGLSLNELEEAFQHVQADVNIERYRDDVVRRSGLAE